MESILAVSRLLHKIAPWTHIPVEVRTDWTTGDMASIQRTGGYRVEDTR